MKTQVVGFDLEQYIPDGGGASIDTRSVAPSRYAKISKVV